MDIFIKVLLTILTLLTVIVCAFCGVLGIIPGWPFMASGVCFVLAAMFGYFFSYNDIRYWILYLQGKLPSQTKK